MAEAVKISDASECFTCKTTPIQEQVVQCYVCKNHYHAYCEAAGNEAWIDDDGQNISCRLYQGQL